MIYHFSLMALCGIMGAVSRGWVRWLLVFASGMNFGFAIDYMAK